MTVLIVAAHVAYWTLARTAAWLAFYRWFADLPAWRFLGLPVP